MSRRTASRNLGASYISNKRKNSGLRVFLAHSGVVKTSTISIEKTASYLLDVHVPNDRIAEDTQRQSTLREDVLVAPDTADASFFTEVEMIKASRTFKNDKEPGPDLIEVRVLKAAIRVIPGQITKLFNGCLQ